MCEEVTVSWCSRGDQPGQTVPGQTATGSAAAGQVDRQIFDAMTEFIAQLMQRGERLADRFGVPVSCVKALRQVETSVSMKALGQLLHCDPSFVTMIADVLEKRGLAKREPGTVDRRVKNLVLTDLGLEVKVALDQEMLGMMPWAKALTVTEREQFLELIRKMNLSLAEPTGATALGEVTASTSARASAADSTASAAATTSP